MGKIAENTITYEHVKRFCAPEVMRYGIGEPWINKGVAVATNGRAIVEVYDPQFKPPVEEGRKPDYESLFDLFAHPDLEWHELGEKQCTVCEYGRLEKDCETCKGLCFVVCEFDCQHDCPSCDDGLEYEVCCTPRLAGIDFDEYWLNPFRQFANVEYAKADKDSIFIRFDGGRGKLMGIDPE